MKFSVIIPVYNKANTIQSAVESVYAQTIQDFELIIVDDGSQDSLEKSVAAYRDEPNFRLIHQANGGVSVARNTGIEHAQGEYVCFLDADDLWKPNHLEVLEHLMAKYPQSEAFFTSLEIVSPDGSVLHSSEALKEYEKDFETSDFLGVLNRTAYYVVHTNSVCVKKTLLEREDIRFEPGVRIGEDTDVWYRLGLKNKVAVSKCETTRYRREYSTATQAGNHTFDWIFCRRAEKMLQDDQISSEVKASIVELLDRFRMTSSREYMVLGDRKNAKKILSNIKNKKNKRYVLTYLFTCLPYFMCKRLLGR